MRSARTSEGPAYVPYGVLASVVVVGMRLLEAAERSLKAGAEGAIFLFLAFVLGASALGLAQRRPWGRRLTLCLAASGLLLAFAALLAPDPALFVPGLRLLCEALFLLVYLASGPGARWFTGARPAP